MSVSVQFNTTSLIPAPMVSVGKEHTEGGDGGILCSTFNITLNGVIIKPLNGASTQLSAILAEQATIRNTFSQSLATDTTTGAGKTLTISTGGASTQYVGCHVQSIDFDGGSPREMSLNQSCFYTIVLKCTDYTADGDSFGYNIVSASENWEVEYAEDIKDVTTNLGGGSNPPVRTAYRVSHTVSATGKPKYASASTLDTYGLAWQQAREYVLANLPLQGLNNATLTGGAVTTDVLTIPSSNIVSKNHVRSQSVDEKAGSFSVTETFLLYDSTNSENAIEDLDLSVSTNPSETGKTTLSFSVTITGLRTGLSTTDDSYTNALARFDAIDDVDNTNWLSRADTLAAQLGTGLTFNPIPLSKNVTKNPVAGTVTCNIEFDDRPALCFASTGALSDRIEVRETHPGYLFGATSAIGRSIMGPVLQWLGCGTESKRSLTIEVVWPQETSNLLNPVGSHPHSTPARKAAIKGVISGAKPQGVNVASNKVFYSAPRESWDPKSGRYTLEIEWTYEYSGLAIFNPQLT